MYADIFAVSLLASTAGAICGIDGGIGEFPLFRFLCFGAEPMMEKLYRIKVKYCKDIP